jgi:membrane-bound lytic murein transglycosylase D
MKKINFYQIVAFALLALTGISEALAQVSANNSPTANFPLITNRYAREYNGDSIIHVTANGIPAIVAMPGQQLRTILPALGISRADFVKFNDLPNVVTDQMVAGAVYYLKPKANRASADFHVVQHKETLWDVSQRYGIRKSQLLSRNRLSADAVTAGTRLMLNKRIGRKDKLEVVPMPPTGPDTPGPWDRLLQEFAPRPTTPATATAVTPGTSQQAVIPNARYHTVQPSESLFTVSQLYNVNILDLKKWNNLQSGTVNPGERLIVNGHELPGIGAPIATAPASEPIILPAGTLPATTSLPTAAMDTPATTGQPAATGLPVENFFDKPAVEEPATAGPAPMVESEMIHIVKAGEGIWGIARQYDVSAKDVMAWNGFDNNTQLKTNQQVIIRKLAPSTAPTTTATTAPVDFNAAAAPATLPRTGMNALDPPGINTFAPGTATAVTATTTTPVPTTATATPVVESEIAGIYHTVAANENIFMLANQYAARVEDIRRWNNLQVGAPLTAGQRLKVGEKPMETARPVTTDAAARPATAPVAAPANARTHIVEKGETLFAISRKYGTTVNELKRLNNIPDEKINAGQSLIVGTADRATAPQQQTPSSQPQGSAKPAAKPAPKSTTGTTGSVVLSGGITVNNNLPPDQLGTSFGVSQAVSGEQSAYYQLAAPNTKIIGAPPSTPASTAKPSAKRQQTTDVHVVMTGETIYSISRKYKVSVDQLMRLNNKASEQIVVGEKLKVK